MENIKDLLDKGLTNRAATALYDALFYLINSVPNIDLTHDQFDTLLPKVVEKMQDPDSVQPEPTGEPGDDVRVQPSKAKLHVEFTGLKNNPDPIDQFYSIGQVYSFEAKEVDGYIANPKSMTGLMTGKGVNAVVEYTKLPAVIVEPSYAHFEGREKDDLSQTIEAEIHGDETDKVEYRIKKATYKWTPADPKVLRYYDSYFPSFIVTAPKDIVKDEASAKKVRFRTFNLNHGGWDVRDDFWDIHERHNKKDDGDNCKDLCTKGCKMPFWPCITPELLKSPNGPDGSVHWLFQFDWNGDGIYEQEFDFVIDPTITLVVVDSEKKVIETRWPV